MAGKGKNRWCRFRRQTKGAAAAEFAVIFSLFLLVMAMIIDFGHAYYMKQVITNASREGARYGITYKTYSSGLRTPPNALTPSIADYVLNNYLTGTYLPRNANPTIAVGGTGYATGTRGNFVEVTVSATKTWLLAAAFVPGLGRQRVITAKTVMLCE
jgi:Flp pilus assembly protein TadG